MQIYNVFRMFRTYLSICNFVNFVLIGNKLNFLEWVSFSVIIFKKEKKHTNDTQKDTTVNI